MNLAQIDNAVQGCGLIQSGAFHPKAGEDWGTLVLLSPAPDFWTRFQTAPEATNDVDPIDNWSKRVITELANRLGATPVFPFGGPPYAPFLDYAKQSGRAFSSPVGMLVHDTQGLMVSYRGALGFVEKLPLPNHKAKSLPESPCDSCAEKPCLTACPVGAFDTIKTDGFYNVRACKDFLQTDTGCLDGCKVRRSCPISAGAGRGTEHSAYHMQVFKNSP